VNQTHIKDLLLDKERELTAALARTKTEAREAADQGVEGDAVDQTVNAENREALLQESSSEWTQLVQVRDALKRLEDGTYGKCVDCGRPIEPARLKAIPWTPYCLADQERHDKENGEHAAPTL
jgi:RNA polymerase-binding transcription factor